MNPFAGAQQPGYGAPPPGAYGGNPYGQPNPYGAPQNPYGQNPYGAPQNPYGAPQNPYGAPQMGMGAPGMGMGMPGMPAPVVDPVKAMFDAVDSDRSGSIDAEELKRALQQGGMEFNSGTANRLIRMFDRSGDGKIDCGEFRSLHQWVTQMSNAFHQVDTSRNGLLDGQEVRRALATSGYQLSDPTFQLMMRKLDKQRIGEIGLDGYMDMCLMLGHARNTFGFYDKTRCGQVTFNFDSFCCAMLSMGVV